MHPFSGLLLALILSQCNRKTAPFKRVSPDPGFLFLLYHSAGAGISALFLVSFLLRAGACLREDYPVLFARFRVMLPDEKTRRVGQSVAAASLPEG
jgi:hypothetical protein